MTGATLPTTEWTASASDPTGMRATPARAPLADVVDGGGGLRPSEGRGRALRRKRSRLLGVVRAVSPPLFDASGELVGPLRVAADRVELAALAQRAT